MDQAKIYLCKADSSMLGTLTGIQTQTCTLKRNATDLWELTFDVDRYIDADGSLVQSDYYDSIDEMMRLYLDSTDIQAFFVIDSEPVIKGDGYQETKSVSAHSVECELCNLYLKNFKINCGTPDSQEYLACKTDQDENTCYYNVDQYTKLPHKYISLVNYGDTQLSLLHLALQGTGWTVKEGIDEELCKIQGSFETSDSVYSFLMKSVSPAARVIFEFDRKHKTVGMVKADNYGEDTGIFITMRNLMNSFEVTSTSNEAIITKCIPTGAGNLGIEQVNFGQDSILNLDYFMNAQNEYGNYKFVSARLHDSYCKWKQFREEEPFSVSICLEESEENKKNNEEIKGTRREIYTELTRRYNQTLLDINELKNRVPNDGCIIDYTTYTQEELDAALTAYKNALAALKTLYKNEYGVKQIGSAPDYSQVPSSAVSIKETPYWYDFYAYQEVIIPKIERALEQYVQTGSGEKNQIDSYLYEWSLYGLDELQAKKKAWSEAANLLFHECFIVSETTDNPPQYRTADDNGWNSLTDTKQKAFTSKSAYITQLNQYLDYMAFDKRENSITKTKCKGIIRTCDDEIANRLTKIGQLEERLRVYDMHRKELAAAVMLDSNFKIQISEDTYVFPFNEEDVNVINGMIREQEFVNENIITTSLDDIISTIDIQEKIYQSAVTKLHELSQPQYSFRTELDNLYALDAFKAFQKPFDIGNFIRVGLETHEEICDNRFVKLRLISISHNPLQADEHLSVEFSTMTKALNGINDLAFLLGNESGTSSGSSSSSGTSGGTYGNNDANVQISNNMLNALLRTETFGTAVNDVILDSMQAQNGKFATLFSKSGAFDAFEAGQIKVSGDCLVHAIKSQNYTITTNSNEESVETGSILDLSDGTFSFADGKLKWDNSTLSINGNTTVTGSVITESTFKGNVNAIKLSAKRGTIAGWKFNKKKGFFIDDEKLGITGKKYLGKNGISMGELFHVNSDGFILKDFLCRTNVNNYALIPQELTGGSYDVPCSILVYNYNDFDENQSFQIFFHYRTYLYVTIQGTDNEPEHSTFYIDNIVTQYKFKKNKIKSIHDLPQKEKDIIIEKVNDTLFIDKIGYIDKADLEFVDSNLDDACNDNMDGYTILEHELSDEIIPYGIYQENPLIPAEHDDDIYEDNWRHKWAIEKGHPQLELIGTCSSSNEHDTHILSDLETIPGVTLNSHSKKIAINDTCMTDKGFSSKYMYKNVSVSGKPLYINSDGTIGLSGSSKRYKNSISTNLTEISDPHGLYDIDIVQYKYNDTYFSSPNDEGIGKYFIGFIAENIAEKFKDGATFDKDKLPDGWDIRYMFPAALKLIQEQHAEIESIKKQLQQLREHITP